MMSVQPKVSVIIPSLNVGKYVSECLESVIHQTLKEIEIMTKRINNIDDEIKSLEVVKETRKQAEDILKKYKHIKELNKIIIDEFIDKIYIGEIDKETNSRDIEIEWNFEF